MAALCTALMLVAGCLSVAGEVWHGLLSLPGSKLTLVVRSDGKAATLDVPEQGAKGIPLTRFEVRKGVLRFEARSIGASFEGQLNESGTRAAGKFRQGGLELPLTMQKGEPNLQPPRRPQTPRPPFPYDAEEVAFDNPEASGVRLAGTLVKPKGEGPFPCVVMVTGSGPQDRDQTILDHKPFAVWADALAKAGVASLRCDDRGVGKSTGLFSTATSDDFASDARAAVAFLKTRKDIDAGRIGLMGHSEGGLIAPMAAADHPDVAFVVLLAPPAVPGRDIVVVQSRLIAEAEGAKPEDAAKAAELTDKLVGAILSEEERDKAAERALAVYREAVAAMPESERASAEASMTRHVAQLNSPWMRRFLVLDPRPYLARLKVPVLAVWGEYDLQVPPSQSLPEARRALAANPRAELKVLSMLNHLFQLSASGRLSEYGRLEETIHEIALREVVGWVARTTGIRK
ncbi:MAG: CocE/NonD family hydrolase [Fimbriimonadales bacterium]|nr:CocE/NonD family hydrolase [Fimbriimonadales bacterium]